MCECCGGDCRLCSPDPGFLEFPETIESVIIENNCMVINGKFKMIPTMNPESPFRIEMKQPLNEAYHNEILESYQKISETFDDFTQLMRKRVPYESWPKHLQIAGVSESLMGCSAPGEYLKGNTGPIPEPLPIPDYTPPAENSGSDLSKLLLCKIRDLGRVEQKLSDLLEDDCFNNTSKHDPYWKSEYELESDKLDDLRRKFSCLHDNLWDLLSIIRRHDEYEES